MAEPPANPGRFTRTAGSFEVRVPSRCDQSPGESQADPQAGSSSGPRRAKPVEHPLLRAHRSHADLQLDGSRTTLKIDGGSSGCNWPGRRSRRETPSESHCRNSATQPVLQVALGKWPRVAGNLACRPRDKGQRGGSSRLRGSQDNSYENRGKPGCCARKRSRRCKKVVRQASRARYARRHRLRVHRTTDGVCFGRDKAAPPSASCRPSRVARKVGRRTSP